MTYTIYCDMDGVLVAFEEAVVKLANESLRKPETLPVRTQKMLFLAQKEIQELYSRKEFITDDINLNTSNLKAARNLVYRLTSGNIEFWANLPWLEDGKQLWNYIKQYKPSILSSPIDEDCRKGKLIWVQRELNLPIQRIFITQDKNKYANKNSILIDDMKRNISTFNGTGGIGILHVTSSNTISQLKSILG